MKTNLDEDFKLDLKKLDEGTWIQVGKCKFLIKKFDDDNPTSRAILADYQKKYVNTSGKIELSEDQDREMGIYLFVDISVWGWENLIIDGEKVEFSKDLMKKLLIKREYTQLYKTLKEHSTNFNNFKELAGEP